MSPARRMAAVVAVAAAVVTAGGCASSAGTQADGARGTESGSTGASALRHETDPIERRFPEFEEIRSTSWVSKVLNAGSSGVPGPSDVRLTGVAAISASAVSGITEKYPCKKSRISFAIPKTLSGEIKQSDGWCSSKELDQAITQGSYEGTFYLDVDRRVVVFDAVNPVARSG